MSGSYKLFGLRINPKFVYFTFSIFLILVAESLFFSNLSKFSILAILPFVFLLIFFTFKKYYLFYFILSLGAASYLQFDYRIQIVTIVSLMIIVLFITYKDTDTFNDLQYPRTLSWLSVLLVIQVFLSSVISKYVSFRSVIYAVVFSVFVIVSYVIYRSVKSHKHINKLIDIFILLILISTIIDLLEVVYTGNLRSVGLMGFAIMDFTVFALLLFIFRNYLFGKTNAYVHTAAFLVFVLTIFHQSRFAWLGFIISLIYGIFITVKYYPNVKLYFRKRAISYVLIAIIFIAAVFVFGFNDIILSRVSEINLDFFQGDPLEGQYLSNSLESRLLIWLTAYNAFAAQPVFGVGYFMFPLISENYNVLPEILYQLYIENLDAHTTYFNILAETGITGFILFLSYFVFMFRLSFKSLKMSLTEDQKSLSIILNIFCFFVLVHSIYSGAFTFGLNAFHMWFMFALNTANYMLLKRKFENKHYDLI